MKLTSVLAAGAAVATLVAAPAFAANTMGMSNGMGASSMPAKPMKAKKMKKAKAMKPMASGSMSSGNAMAPK